MSIKKIARIIVSPILFIFIMAAIIVIPIGLMAFMVGIISIIGNLFKDNLDDDEKNDLWVFTFSIFLLPYFTVRKFILAGSIEEYYN